MNRCEACPSSCCVNFSIGREVVDPVTVARELADHPYIRRIGDRLIISSGRERIVGIYSCKRHDPETGLCKGYDTIPRPSFCTETGEKDRPLNCVLAPVPRGP